MTSRYRHPISELQSRDRLYHGAPEWRVEKVLEKGISVREASKSQNGKKIQCITPSIEEAIYFTHHVHLMFDDRNKYLGVFQIDPSKLSNRIRDQFEPDPMNPASLITYRSIPSSSVDKLVLVDVTGSRDDMLDEATKLNKTYGIDVAIIEYDLATRTFQYKVKQSHKSPAGYTLPILDNLLSS